MQMPVDIAFRQFEPSEQIRSEIAAQARRLEKISPRITSCHVVVSGPPMRHRSAGLFQVQLRIAMPGREDVVVDRHGHALEREHSTAAIRGAFTAAVRQIEDAARQMRDQVKQPVESHGRVAKFLAGGDCGFIETPDGREIYFHRNAVLNGAFDRLTVGSEVRFVEEEGMKGSHASRVRLGGKHHLA
jgi:cold shock CspA family protein